MTATTQPIRQAAALRPATPTSPLRAATAAGPVAAVSLLQAVVGIVTAFAATLGASLRDLADAGQLGPDAEREIGRWSGGRI
jgi:hypothetical protein